MVIAIACRIQLLYFFFSISGLCAGVRRFHFYVECHCYEMSITTAAHVNPTLKVYLLEVAFVFVWVVDFTEIRQGAFSRRRLKTVPTAL